MRASGGERPARIDRSVMDITVTDEPEEHRYAARSDGTLLGFAAYQSKGDVRVFTHTEVFDAYEGKGVASVLVRGALEDVRRNGRSVIPVCRFVRSYIERHPDYASL